MNLGIKGGLDGFCFGGINKEIVMTIYCGKCATFKEPEEFSNDSYRHNGKKAYCKPCMSSYQSNYKKKKELRKSVFGYNFLNSRFENGEEQVVGWNGDDEIYF